MGVLSRWASEFFENRDVMLYFRLQVNSDEKGRMGEMGTELSVRMKLRRTFGQAWLSSRIRDFKLIFCSLFFPPYFFSCPLIKLCHKGIKTLTTSNPWTLNIHEAWLSLVLLKLLLCVPSPFFLIAGHQLQILSATLKAKVWTLWRLRSCFLKMSMKF